jgi:hypothetical protein
MRNVVRPARDWPAAGEVVVGRVLIKVAIMRAHVCRVWAGCAEEQAGCVWLSPSTCAKRLG